MIKITKKMVGIAMSHWKEWSKVNASLTFKKGASRGPFVEWNKMSECLEEREGVSVVWGL
jgi:hypothetical protein